MSRASIDGPFFGYVSSKTRENAIWAGTLGQAKLVAHKVGLRRSGWCYITDAHQLIPHGFKTLYRGPGHKQTTDHRAIEQRLALRIADGLIVKDVT
jgi:hypothetical protein